MALSAYAKQRLDNAIAQASKEGYVIFGFIVDAAQTEIQPYGNGTEGISDFIHNIEQGTELLKEVYLTKPHEA
jgi:hypothetical protein